MTITFQIFNVDILSRFLSPLSRYSCMEEKQNITMQTKKQQTQQKT